MTALFFIIGKAENRVIRTSIEKDLPFDRGSDHNGIDALEEARE